MDNSNQQPQSQQPANLTPKSVNSSHKSKIVPIGFGILFVLIAVGSYILGIKQNQTIVQSQQTSVVPTTIPSPTSILDETANPDSIGTNWKTYIDSKSGYLFRYPLTGLLQP